MPHPAAAPRMSVIMPTYDRPGVVDRCLAALVEQTLSPDDFEVIVADDGSPTETRQVVARWQARVTAPLITHLFQANAGANAARNLGIRASRGTFLLFINDDTIPSRCMLERHLNAHWEHGDDRVAVLGRVTVSPELPRSRLAALHLDRAFEAIGARRQLDWRWFFTCNISVNRALLERGGVFEEAMRYHEDLELSERLSHHGLRVVYEPEALGYHYHFLTEREFLGVARREARALVAWARKAPHLTGLLGEFGFEPALAASARWKNRARSVFVNRWTILPWCAAARCCPAALEGAALKIYLQVYQSAKRRCLLEELRAAGRD